ncbi:hypothetical protein Tco_0215162 [Tanacetum coccineum]
MEQSSRSTYGIEFCARKESRENIALQDSQQMVCQKERIGLSLKLLGTFICLMESTAAKEVKIREKRRISIAKGKEHVDSTFTLSTANTPPQSTGNTPTDSDDDTPTDGVFSTNSFDAEEGGVADYNNLDSTIDVSLSSPLRIHKIHPQSQIIGKKYLLGSNSEEASRQYFNQHQACCLSYIPAK